MTIRCEQIDDLLLEGDPLALETAAQHARNCPACMETLTAWNEISETAASMKTTWENDLLWPRIERAIKQETKRSSPWQMWRVAAVVLLTFGIAASAWFVSRSKARDYDEAILRSSAMDEVERAENAHIAAIEQLERVAEKKLDEAETPLMASYREKLLLLDDAIAQCETQIEQNRQNAHLRKQLLAMYSEKQQTLQGVVREGTNAQAQ
jgi:hypothetical protein